jgi:signal peptidase I
MINDYTGGQKSVSNQLTCGCGKVYKYRQGLSLHKKKCLAKSKVSNEPNNDKTEEKDLSDKEIIKMLIKENSEFKNMILEVVKTIQPNNTTNNNNTNSHNTTNNNFNLQFFLNDTCKDAINLVDFVQGLQVQLKDLEETARLGYSEGVSKIFINGLNELDVNMRPIHCSDSKRETLYIKDQDEWKKEDSSKTHLTKAIKTVGKKNIQQIFEWQKKYPDYNDPDSRNNDKYLKMLSNAMNGSTDEEQNKNMNKIVKNIAKEVIIDKNI